MLEVADAGAFQRQLHRSKVALMTYCVSSRGIRMRSLYALVSFVLIFSVSSCSTAPGDSESEPIVPSEARGSRPADTRTAPELREVGSRGFFVLDGPFAEFDPSHPSVEIWTPKGDKKAPIMVYAHGGAGYREDDRARVEMFRRNGFATISFDSYVMNGFDDWNFVTRKVANTGKQSMIWRVFKERLSMPQRMTIGTIETSFSMAAQTAAGSYCTPGRK